MLYIKQARRQLESARVPGVDAQSSYQLTYQAAIKALIGALLSIGRRVTAGDAGHAVLIAEARARLHTSAREFDRLDRMRRTRHAALYAVVEVSDIQLRTAHEDAQRMIDSAARFVRDSAARPYGRSV